VQFFPIWILKVKNKFFFRFRQKKEGEGEKQKKKIVFLLVFGLFCFKERIFMPKSKPPVVFG
jgi:hypothetical protein